ncbi:phytase [Nocardioides sp. MAHUQ-72]|uniref:phytase n=1 Tax=unclassified Nocardioides TaxID=2615069 RepID=UPI003623A24F
MRATLVVALLVLVGLLAPAAVPGERGAGRAEAATSTVSYVADSAASRNTSSPWIVVPSSVQPGDRLVLLLSLAAADRTVSSPTRGTWSLDGDRSARTMRTLVWSKVAVAGDAGARVDVPLSASTKGTIQLAAYRGVDPGPLTVVSSAATTTSTVRRTPVVSAPQDAWVASYWAGKSASASSWTPPAGVAPRGAAANSGSGRIVSLLADTGGPAAAGSYGDLAATSSASTTAATTWSVVLPPSTGNQPPVARFTSTCGGLGCSFDASTSSDAEGAVASYDWDFGDGTTGVGAAPDHDYPAPGSYDVVLTVTDGDGATASVTHAVTVSDGPVVVGQVAPVAETEPVLHTGDAADDPAIWVDPADPAASLVIGNDKQGALEVYDLTGARVQRITTSTSFWGNVDVRQGVTVGSRTLDVVIAYNNGLRPFAVNAATHLLEPVGGGTGSIPTNGGEGVCAYHSAVSGDLYAFVITRGGRVREYRIGDGDGDGLLQGTLVREFEVGSEAEGCVADDATGRLYVSEEDVALWQYGAEPGDGSARVMVDAVRPDGHLAYDIEGLALAETGASSGYLIASAQNGADPNNSYFAVYDRESSAYLGSFDVVTGASADGCERTDGVAAYAGPLGPAFPAGLFVCQDNGNTTPGAGNQDFKLVRLDQIIVPAP